MDTDKADLAEAVKAGKAAYKERLEQLQAGFWTVQQFWTGPTGQPWYALQQHNDSGVTSQFTGYRWEIDELVKSLGVVPEELPATTEDEFLRRSLGELPKIKTLRKWGCFRRSHLCGRFLLGP